MNLSVYLFLAVSVISVVFAQQSDDSDDKNKLGLYTLNIVKKSSKENLNADIFPNATLVLENRYITGIKLLIDSQEIITNGISNAKKLVLENPEAARQLLQQAFNNASIKLFEYGNPTLGSLGEAFSSSNEGARQGLNVAHRGTERAGFSVLYALNDAENFIMAGLNAGGNADEMLFKAGQLAVDTGYASAFYSIGQSIQDADQALRDAQRNPIEERDVKQNCSSVEKGPEGLKAQTVIDNSAEDALQRGANSELVQKLKDVLSCALGNFVEILKEGILDEQNWKQIEGLQPLEARYAISKRNEAVENKISNVVSSMYIVIGDVALKSGNQSNNKIGEAITALTTGQGNIGLAMRAAADFIALGQRDGEDASKLGFQAAFRSGAYAEIAFIQSIARCAQIVFSVL